MSRPRVELESDAAGQRRPLSALLSQVLVGFTLELDMELERRMKEAGYPGAGLSLVVWLNLIRFLADGPQSVDALTGHSLATKEQMKHSLGCLERWRFIILYGKSSTDHLREGWGSGRGIQGDWLVELTKKGRRAADIWPQLLTDVERKWSERFGAAKVAELRAALQELVAQLDFEPPHGLPADWQVPRERLSVPRTKHHRSGELPLPVLLSQALFAFVIEFDKRSKVPLAFCANTLRILGPEPTPLADIPRLTGCSPETSGVGWQIKPFLILESNAALGRSARLNERGLRVRRGYFHFVTKIEKEWEDRFGRKLVQRLRRLLERLFSLQSDGRSILSLGLAPPPGVMRSGEQAPSLGRRTVGPAARSRMRAMRSQTKDFLANPAAALPHYPLWDMNRGFGP